MDPDVARHLGHVGATLTGLGLATFAGRRDRVGLRLGLSIAVQGGLLFAVAFGGAWPSWALVVLVAGGVWATLATSAAADCERATGSTDVADWTPRDAPDRVEVVTPHGETQPIRDEAPVTIVVRHEESS